MITKQQAHTLAGNNYQLADRTGAVYSIVSVHKTMFILKPVDEHAFSSQFPVLFEIIGKLYFILARPLERLIHQVKPGFFPLVELSKACGIKFLSSFRLESGKVYCIFDGIDCFEFRPESNKFVYTTIGSASSDYQISEKHDIDQVKMHEMLLELNFSINLPEGSWKEITETWYK